jgi:hypothetical protein
MASPVLMMVLLLIGLVATSTLATPTLASSIDVDDLKWSWNASTVFVVPTSLPRSYYTAHIYIPMVSTPKAGLCRFENRRDDSTGRGWLKVDPLSLRLNLFHQDVSPFVRLLSYHTCIMI